MVYTLGIGVYVYILKSVQNNFVMGFKFWWSWGSGYSNSKFTICTTIFVFSYKTLFFGGLGALFVYFWEVFRDFYNLYILTKERILESCNQNQSSSIFDSIKSATQKKKGKGKGKGKGKEKKMKRNKNKEREKEEKVTKA